MSTLKTTKSKEFILILILIIFHLVGVLSLLSANLRPLILPMSSLNLLLAFLILFISFENKRKFAFFCFMNFLAGYTFEYIGVHTKMLFGSYHYGENLGFKVFDIPIIIGVNWCILVVSSSVITNYLTKNIFIKTTVASALMTILDVLIEPVAIESDFWSWDKNQIPIYNYVCWFLLSLPLNYMYQKFNFKEQNKVAACLYFIFVLFFLALNIL